MSKKPDISPEDAALFRRRARVTRRLAREAVEPAARAEPGTRPEPHQPVDVDRRAPSPPGAGGEVQSFLRPGLQQRMLRRLRRGQIPVSDEIDLHGMTVAEARRALLAFLAECSAGGRRCVRVVHGKGRGSRDGRAVIKWQVDAWLREHSAVLAFCTAPQTAGGTGAVHVLLRA